MTRISEIARIVVKDAPFEPGSMEESAWLVWKSMREEAVAKLDRRVYGALATERYDGRHGAGYKMRGTMVYHFEKLFPQLLIQGEKARVDFTKTIALFLRDTGNAECLSKSSKPPVWFVRDVFEARKGVVLRLPYQPTEMERKLTPQEAGETREPGQVTTTGRQAPPISQDVPTVVPAMIVDYAGPEFPFPNPELVWCLGEIDPHQPLPDAEKEAEAHRHLANNEMFKNRTIAHTRAFLVQRTRSAVESSMRTKREIRDVLLGAERPLMAKEIAGRRGKPGAAPHASKLLNEVWLPAGLVRETTGKKLDKLWVWANRSECAPNQYTRPHTEPPVPQRGGAHGSKKATPTLTETVKEEPQMGAEINPEPVGRLVTLPSGRTFIPNVKPVRPLEKNRQKVKDGLSHQWRNTNEVAFHGGAGDNSILREALYLELEGLLELKKGQNGTWLMRWKPQQATPAPAATSSLSLDGLSDYPEVTAFVQDTAIAMIVTIETVAKRLRDEAAVSTSYDEERVAKLEAEVSDLQAKLTRANNVVRAYMEGQ